MKLPKKRKKKIDAGLADPAAISLVALVGVLVLWWFVANLVFHLRHPTATSTQCLIHTWDALMFRKIPKGDLYGE